jgi:hypothetical protein
MGHSFHQEPFHEKRFLMISAGRIQKLLLTRQQQVFTVRHRLRLDSLARAFAPFMVELFVAAGLSSGPRTGQVRTGRSPGSVLPTQAKVERA